MDVVSRLLKDRILLLGGRRRQEVANVLVCAVVVPRQQVPERTLHLWLTVRGSVSASAANLIPCSTYRAAFRPLFQAREYRILLGAGARSNDVHFPIRA
jgi:hypothetical protein